MMLAKSSNMLWWDKSLKKELPGTKHTAYKLVSGGPVLAVNLVAKSNVFNRNKI
jgi:hypothetical protein